jgi:hypothetical protein
MNYHIIKYSTKIRLYQRVIPFLLLMKKVFPLEKDLTKAAVLLSIIIQITQIHNRITKQFIELVQIIL